MPPVERSGSRFIADGHRKVDVIASLPLRRRVIGSAEGRKRIPAYSV